MPVPIFPTLKGVAFPVGRSPNWSTERHQATSGRKTAFQRFVYPLYDFELTFDGDGFLRSDPLYKEYQDLIAFYNFVMSTSTIWAYNAPDDNTVTGQLIGTGDGVQTVYQLLRTIAGATFSWTDPVFLVNTLTNLFVDGTPQVLNTDYVISETGTIKFASPPGNGLAVTWDGTFYWACRFPDDKSSFKQFLANLYSNNKVNFSTEKVDVIIPAFV